MLANVGGLSDAECAPIRRFVQGGGPLIGTADSTLVRVKLPEGISGRSAKTLVATGSTAVTAKQGWAEFAVRPIPDHEVIVLS